MGIISIPIKAKQEFIALCQKAKDAKTEEVFEVERIRANTYSNCIKDICGLSVWGEIVRIADLEIGSETYPTCCGIPLFFNNSIHR